MKVLILYEHFSHNHTIDNLFLHLNGKGIAASSCNIVYWRFRNGAGNRRPLWLRLLAVYARIPRVRGLLNYYLRQRAMLKLSEEYDIIDVHFFSALYDRLIKALKQRGKHVKVTVWGHDFYELPPERKELQRECYHLVDRIQVFTQRMKDDFLADFPEFRDKIRIARFGIVQFGIIDELLREGTDAQYREELQVPRDKILMTLATNGTRGHQHLKILESVGSLSPELKEQLFLIVPMTYGADHPYIEQVRKQADTTGVPFLILTTYLTLKELCKYRIVSDVTVTIQLSDALGQAVLEHIYTGEILIAGDWLPYQVLDEHGIFYLKTSVESLTDRLTDSISNHHSMSQKCEGNREKLTEIASWNRVIDDWCRIYNEIEN